MNYSLVAAALISAQTDKHARALRGESPLKAAETFARNNLSLPQACNFFVTFDVLWYNDSVNLIRYCLFIMYRFSVFLCFFFASLVIALFTLIVSDDTFAPGSDNAAILVQDLTSLRAWVVVIGLVGFSWNAATKKPNALLVTVLTALAWVMFLEDYMVLDSVLFIANHPMAQAVIITRPVFLVALTYVAFKQWEVDLS